MHFTSVGSAGFFHEYPCLQPYLTPASSGCPCAANTSPLPACVLFPPSAKFPHSAPAVASDTHLRLGAQAGGMIISAGVCLSCPPQDGGRALFWAFSRSSVLSLLMSLQWRGLPGVGPPPQLQGYMPVLLLFFCLLSYTVSWSSFLCFHLFEVFCLCSVGVL